MRWTPRHSAKGRMQGRPPFALGVAKGRMQGRPPFALSVSEAKSKGADTWDFRQKT